MLVPPALDVNAGSIGFGFHYLTTVILVVETLRCRISGVDLYDGPYVVPGVYPKWSTVTGALFVRHIRTLRTKASRNFCLPAVLE